MANFAQWVEGARPRTLPNAVAPVIAGTGAAAWLHAAVWWKALLALACGSRSTNKTRWSPAAKEAPKFTAVVVLPTPPF